MTLKVLVNQTDLSGAVLLEQTTITKETSGRVSTAELTFSVDSDAALYDEATYDSAVYGVDVRPLYEIELRDADTDALLFAGWVTKVTHDRIDDHTVELHCSCQDRTVLLEQASIVSEVFEGASDRDIIQALVAGYAPRLTALTGDVAELLPSIGYWEVKDKSLRQALQDLADFTGAEFYVDPLKALKYFAAVDSPAAAFALDTDGATEFRVDEFERNAERLINRCTVLGGFVNGGAEISVTFDDPVSIAEYGVHAATIVDREITLTVDALLRAQATVEANAYPLETGKITLWTDGLDVGQLLVIAHGQFGIDSDYMIRSIEMQWVTADEVEYYIGFGDPPTTLDRVLRMIAARTAHSTQAPVAVPAPGSVTDSSVGAAGLSTGHLYGTINSSGNVIISTTALTGDINAGGNVTVSTAVLYGDITGAGVTVDAAIIQGTVGGANVIIDAGRIQGSIEGDDVTVSVDVLEGVIIADEAVDGIIDSISKYAEPLRPIMRLASDPALPDTDYPVGSVYLRTTDGQFRKNVAGAWQDVTEAEAVTGKLEFHHVGSVNVEKFVGLIVAGQIDSLTMGQVTGNLDVTRIDNLGTLSIGSFSGNLDITRVDNIDTIDINTFSGTIDSLNATTVTLTGTWDDSHIGSVAAGKITAGVVAATIELQSPLITGGSIELSDGTDEVHINAVDSNHFVKCFATAAPTTFTSVSRLGFRTYYSGNLTGGLIQNTVIGGVLALYSPTGVEQFVLPGNSPHTAASAGALAGYLVCKVDGTLRKIPYYAT